MSTRYATFDTDLSPAEQMKFKEAGSNAELFAQLAEQVKQAAQEPSLCETCCHAYHHMGKTICGNTGKITENVRDCDFLPGKRGSK